MEVTDVSVAHHEAGHAVIHHVLGACLDLVTIISTDECRGSCHLAGKPVHFCEPEKNTEQSILRWFAGNLAGARAELRYFALSGAVVDVDAILSHGRNDTASRHTVLERPYLLPGVDLKALHARAIDLASDMVVEHWPMIERFAGALLKHGTLSGAQIQAAFSEDMRDAA